jgi:hypothetical protein
VVNQRWPFGHANQCHVPRSCAGESAENRRCAWIQPLSPTASESHTQTSLKTSPSSDLRTEPNGSLLRTTNSGPAGSSEGGSAAQPSLRPPFSDTEVLLPARRAQEDRLRLSTRSARRAVRPARDRAGEGDACRVDARDLGRARSPPDRRFRSEAEGAPPSPSPCIPVGTLAGKKTPRRGSCPEIRKRR